MKERRGCRDGMVDDCESFGRVISLCGLVFTLEIPGLEDFGS